MEYGELHLLHQESNKPIKLSPIIQIMEGPKTNKRACYFYNRVVGSQVHYVSYHHEDDSQHKLDFDDEINEFFSLFSPWNNRNPSVSSRPAISQWPVVVSLALDTSRMAPYEASGFSAGGTPWMDTPGVIREGILPSPIFCRQFKCTPPTASAV